MKLYDFTRAPNPRRVRIFLAEKGITVPMEQIDLFIGANRTPEALGRNPYGGLPVLELDDGTCIAESVAICRYFEDLHPQPALMGVDAKDRAVVEMWNRRMELVLFAHIRSHPRTSCTALRCSRQLCARPNATSGSRSFGHKHPSRRDGSRSYRARRKLPRAAFAELCPEDGIGSARRSFAGTVFQI